MKYIDLIPLDLMLLLLIKGSHTHSNTGHTNLLTQ